MQRKKEIIIGIISLVLITAALTFAVTGMIFFKHSFGKGLIRNTYTKQFDLTKLEKVKALLESNYLKGIEEGKLLDGAISGMTNSLNDPYTVYLNQKDYEDLKTETRGTYAGIGIVVAADKTDNTIMVVSPIEGTPGEKAGILPGDKISKVNGIGVKGSELDKAVSMMKGAKGTQVVLTIIRKDVSNPILKTIIRDNIILKTVKDEVLTNNIGYIRISMFDEKTANDFMKSYDKLMQKKVKGLIIDVRDNPGGLLQQVVDIADRLIPKGTIVYTEDKNKVKKYWTSDAQQAEVPIVLLVNGGSASASEILGGALKDTKKATLIGTKTFGKGVVQEVMDLKDGTALKITISEYFTPKGISINGKGIQPDIVIKLPDKYKASLQVNKTDDTQLQKAIRVLSKK